MMKSLFSGVSGLKSHQTRMDVIGNNIANVNTVGYKSSRLTFSEIYSQTVRGAGGSSTNLGGTNPQQIGLGVTVGAIDVNHSKGSIQRTDSATDIMVDGSGYFIVSDSDAGLNRFYTRAGNFNVDESGYLVNSNGFKVLGMDNKPVQINKSETKPATATEKVLLKGNISFSETKYATTVDVYDSLGDTHTITVNYGELKTAGTDSYRQVYFTGEDKKVVPVDGNLYVKFDSAGNPLGMFKIAGTGSTPAQQVSTTAPIVTTYVPYQAGTAATAAPYFAETALPTTEAMTLKIPGAADLVIPINNAMLYENGDITTGKKLLSQTAQATDAKSAEVGGNAAGSLNSFSISANGEVVGVFTNGEKKTLSTIQLADFDNPAGLMKIGNNLFSETNNSGAAKTGQPGSGSIGSLAPGALEMSNVDLSQEFTDMITTQRGFQANSRIITTTDSMLEELVNLKR